MRAATIALAGMYEGLRDRLRDSGQYEPLTCVCKIDRVVLTTGSLLWKAIAGIPGYTAHPEKRLWRKDYGFARRISGTGSISEIVVESKPTASWFAPFRITVIPQDETGLREGDFRLLLEVLPSVRFTVLEVAWDFPSECVVDLEFVRRYGLFGSTWLRPGSNPYHDKWGNVGSKIVRAYVKWGTSQFRIELELHVKLLRELGISDIFDFRKLRSALFPDHIRFEKLNEQRLAVPFYRSDLPLEKRRIVRKRVKQKAQRSVWEATRYLREEAHLTNVRRFLVPIPEINEVIRVALERMLAQWPKQPLRLGKKP